MKQFHLLLVIRHPVGGIRTFCRYTYTRLDRSLYCFTLVAPECNETRILLENLGSMQVDYHPLPENLGEVEFVRSVTKIVWAGTYDFVHSHGFTAGIAASLGCVLRRTPHLLTCHDVFTDEQFAGFKGSLRRLVVGSSLLFIDRIHCVTEDAQSNLFEYLGILRFIRHRVRAIRNGIDCDHFLEARVRNLRTELGLDDQVFLIGFLGRFMSQKGFRYLLDAMASLGQREDLPKKPLLLTFSSRDGYYREEMAEVERRGLTDSVLFMPFEPDVASTLRGLDVLAMPSLWEACGLLAMEAMVSGIPVIGTSCIGLREVLSDTPARVVPPRDARALEDALVAEMSASSASQARQFAPVAAARFSIDKQVSELEQLFAEVLVR
ncbi:MAG: glycosyltransferase family 1 protein [Thermomicrobiales bacterium]|nr:MAG: glycosyltransferase family 1 protein [Thermomicrobiales bacterium]